MGVMQCNVEFGYQLNICSKDRGKPRKTLIELFHIVFKNSGRTSKKTAFHHYEDQYASDV
jgi:hypothetical protein